MRTSESKGRQRASNVLLNPPSAIGLAANLWDLRVRALDGLEIFNQLLLFPVSQLEVEMSVVVREEVVQGGKPAIVIEAAFVNLLHVPQRAQGRRAVAIIG